MNSSLVAAARTILREPDPGEKVARSLSAAAEWRAGGLPIGEQNISMPARPARPELPELLTPRDMPRRRIGGLPGRIALLHAVAHIELNAIDLAWDLIGRYTAQGWPEAFYADWLSVAADEARHFTMLQSRLSDFDAHYGDLPAH